MNGWTIFSWINVIAGLILALTGMYSAINVSVPIGSLAMVAGATSGVAWINNIEIEKLKQNNKV